MKNIIVQVPTNSCDNCRFNVRGNIGDECNYCLAYLKAIIKNSEGESIQVSDCVEVINKNDK